MSKSKGNFLTVLDSINEFSADCTRLALADAGDRIEDCNFSRLVANASILNLYKEEVWILEQWSQYDSQRSGSLLFNILF